MNPRTAATAFRIVAVAEALSWIGLLAGMYVKYVPGTTELGVKVFGPIHGGIFLAYVVLALIDFGGSELVAGQIEYQAK